MKEIREEREKGKITEVRRNEAENEKNYGKG